MRGDEQSMKVYALLTGRGQNTLQDKNILDILGRPVLYYPATAVKESKYIQKAYCSSDDDKILDAAREIGYEPIKRPPELAAPTAQHIDCIYHALEIIGQKEELPDILVVILANNVTVKTKWVDECIEMMRSDRTVSAVVPVYPDNDHHPFRDKRMAPSGDLTMFDPSHAAQATSSNRQDLPACYFLAHNFWALNVKTLLDKDQLGEPPWGFMGKRVKGYKIEESIDIHDLMDIELAKIWLKNNWEH